MFNLKQQHDVRPEVPPWFLPSSPVCAPAGAERGQCVAVCRSLDRHRDHPLLFLHLQPAQSPALPHQMGKVGGNTPTPILL